MAMERDRSAATSTWTRMTTVLAASSALVLAMGTANVFAEKGEGGEQNEHEKPGQSAKYLHAQAGQLIDVQLRDLHPTQAVLGTMEVYYKLGRYQAGKDTINKRFDDWCEANGQERAASADANSRLDDSTTFSCIVAIGAETQANTDVMKTAVVGRGGRLYLVDGHHTFTSFMESPDGGPNMHVRVRVLGNLSKLEPEAFWKQMEKSGWVWLRDANNQPIKAHHLPKKLGLANFSNDDYRGLVYFTRDIAYAQNAQNANYQEFHWGTWLRGKDSTFDLGAYDLADFGSYLSGVNAAAQLMSALPDSTVVDAPFTAGDLGRIGFNASEFAKASKNYCSTKPGKVAYAMYYFHNILGNEPKITCP